MWQCELWQAKHKINTNSHKNNCPRYPTHHELQTMYYPQSVTQYETSLHSIDQLIILTAASQITNKMNDAILQSIKNALSSQKS